MAGIKFLQSLLYCIPPEWKRRLGVYLGCCDVKWSLEQMKRFGFSPLRILDVGAFQGDWARMCSRVFPEAHITCIEPQDSQQESLGKLVWEGKKIKIIQALLGRTENHAVPFNEIGSGSSVFHENQEKSKSKPMRTIDALIKCGEIAPPQFLKLDVQGYEIEVLDGWDKGFEECEAIQLEISLLPLILKAPFLHEVVAYLYKRGFVMFDLTELIRSPSDGAVWQIDGLFCREDSPLRNNRVWRKA
jgi:FkbM family methyltransferase